MKKTYSILSLLILLSGLSACSTVEKENIITEEKVEDVVTRVDVPVENIIYNYPETKRIYSPGTYVNSEVIDNKTYYTQVVINNYGEIESVILDQILEDNTFYFDNETNRLYKYVEGVEDLIPNAYRYVKDGVIPTIETSISSNDIIEGYPEYDEIIKSLTTVDNASSMMIKDEDYLEGINNLTDKIIKDQGIYAVLMYKSGEENKVSNVEGVDFDISHYLTLLEETLEPILLEKDDSTREANKAYHGLYKTGTYFKSSEPLLRDNELYYVTYHAVVDKFGHLTSVNIDEIIKDNGVYTLRSLVDEDFNKSISLLENQIKNNQGLLAFEYLDKETPDFKKDGLTYESTNYIVGLPENFDVTPYIDLAKNTESDYKNGYTLKQGTYLNSYNDYVMAMTIDNSGNIIAVTLDKLGSSDIAKIEIDEILYDLYSYETVHYIDIDESETETIKYYVYKDQDNYYYVTDYFNEYGQLEFTKGDLVKFDSDIYNEKKSLKRVHINATENTINSSGFLTQSNLYTKHIVENNSINSFNIVDNKATNVEGLNIDLEEINYLLYDTYYKATDFKNQLPNYTNSVVNELNEALSDYKLANGNYYMRSDVPYNNEFLTLTMSVYNNKVVSLIIDKTVYENEHYYSANISKKYTNQSSSLLSTIVFEDFITGILEDYSYDSSDELDKDSDVISATSDMFIFNNSFEKTLLNGLNLRVDEVVSDVDDYLQDLLKDIDGKDLYVVASDDENAGKLNIDLANKLELATNSLGETFSAEIKFDGSDLISVEDLSDTSFELTSKAKDVSTDTFSNISYEITFEGKEFTNHLPVLVLTNDSYKSQILDLEENYLLNKDNPFETVTSGKTFSLKLENSDVSRLGANSNQTIYYNISVSEDVKVSIDSDLIEINYINDIYEIDLPTSSLLETSKYNLEVVDSNNYKIVNSSTSIEELVVTNGVYNKSLEVAESTIRKFVETLTLTEEAKVTVYTNSDDIESISIRAFFDKYDQEEDYLETYQKGEPSIKFDFNILSIEEAIRTTKRSAEHSFTNVQYVQHGEFDLIDTKDVSIDGINVVWDGYVSSSLDNYDNLNISGFSGDAFTTVSSGDTSKYAKAVYYNTEDEENVHLINSPTSIENQFIDTKLVLNTHPSEVLELNMSLEIFNDFASDVNNLVNDNGFITNEFVLTDSIDSVSKDVYLNSMSYTNLNEELLNEFNLVNDISLFYELRQNKLFDASINDFINIDLESTYDISNDFDLTLNVEWFIDGSKVDEKNLQTVLLSKIHNLESKGKFTIDLTAKVSYELNGVDESFDTVYEITIYNNGY